MRYYMLVRFSTYSPDLVSTYRAIPVAQVPGVEPLEEVFTIFDPRTLEFRSMVLLEPVRCPTEEECYQCYRISPEITIVRYD